MNVRTSTLLLIIALFIGLVVSFFSFSAFDFEKSTESSSEIKRPEVLEPVYQFGLSLDSFEVADNIIQRNEFLSNILQRYQIDPTTIARIVEKSKSVFDVRKIVAGNTYTVFTSKMNPTKMAYFVYQPNAIDYVVYDLRDTISVYTGKNKVDTRVENVVDTIRYSLYQSLVESGGDPELAVSLANIYGGVIDFYAISDGDWFKIQYERQYVGDQPVGAGRIKSAVFSHEGKEFSAFYFQRDNSTEGEYYDEEGNSLQRSFLKAPLKFSRISSRYSKRRLHPVQRVWKAHLGTDYAAPRGTPIVATGNGIVTDSRFTSANGNYVKIKHNKVYTTQYLHMSRRAVKPGQRVRQGQVIGYVGSTGLATGPHVCYRFWENGRQVDALKQNFRASTPIAKEYRVAFEKSIKEQKNDLANIATKKKQINYTAYQQGPPSLFAYFGASNSISPEEQSF